MTTDIIPWVPEPDNTKPAEPKKLTEVYVDVVIDAADELSDEAYEVLRNDLEEETDYMIDALRRKHPCVAFHPMYLNN